MKGLRKGPQFYAMKKYAETFYKSRQWQQVRDLAVQRAGGLCERCAKEGKLTPAAVVHHVIPITPENISDPKITMNLDNLMALCVDCHAAMHHEKARARFIVDSAGRIAPRS